jgi:hypothetical protein
MTTILFDDDGKMSWLNWKETNEADKIEYYNDDGQKHGINEIFVKIRLPHKFYEIANSLSIIYNSKSFDDYVSALVYEDIERLLMGAEEIGDAVVHKMTGEKTLYHSKEEIEGEEPEKDSENQDSPTTTETTEAEAADTNRFPTTELPSKEEVERKWGKIPDDS